MPVSYRWHAAPAEDQERTLDLVVDHLMGVIAGPDRMQNPYRQADARRGFSRRLRRATQGKLRPVDEVKHIAKGAPDAILYEIRWDDIPIVQRNADGTLAYLDVNVRLYHGEPQTLPLAVVGLHAHEKFVAGTDDEVWQRQNTEIGKALLEFHHLEQSAWPGF